MTEEETGYFVGELNNCTANWQTCYLAKFECSTL